MSKLDEMRADLTRKYGKAQETSGSETDNSLAAMRQRLMGKYGSAPTEPAVLPRGMGETEQPPIKQIKKSPAATQQVITGAKEGIRGQQDTRERSYAENAGAVQTVNGGGYGAALSAPKEEKPTAASKINGKAAVTGAVAGKGGAQQPVTEAEAIRQMAQQTQKEYDDYIQSGEYLSAVEAQKQRTLDQARAGGYAASAGLLQGIQTPVVGSGYAASSGINSLTPEEEAENAVLKEADRRKAAADYWKTQAVTSENMEMYNSWTAEDKALLSAYRSAEIRGPLGEFRGFYTPQQRAMAREQLFKKYGEDTVKKIAETVEWVESEKKFKREQESTKMAMDETGALGYVLSNISSVPANLVGTFSAPIDYAEQLLTRIGQYPTLNPYSKGNIPNVYVGTVRGETANAIAGEGQEGSIIRKGAALLYQGGMSAVDNIVRVAAGGKFGSLAMAASASFGQTVQAASAQGATPEQAITLGIVNAGIEAATEKIPLDNLFGAAKAGNLKQVLIGALKQGGIEATTEEISLLGTTFAEALILREKSGYNQTIQEQMAQGKSYEAAKRYADLQLLGEAAQTAAVSFISGSLMEGANQISNYTGTKGTPQQGAGSPQRGEAPTQAATPKKQETAQAEQPGAKEQEAVDFLTDAFTQAGKPDNPVASAMEEFQKNGTVSNRAATAILGDPQALEQLTKETGMTLPDTNSGRRKAVKDAVGRLAQNRLEQTRSDAVELMADAFLQVEKQTEQVQRTEPETEQQNFNAAVRDLLGMNEVDTQKNGQYNGNTNNGGTEHAENREQGLSGTYEAGLPGGAGAGRIRGVGTEQIPASGQAPRGMEAGGSMGSGSMDAEPGSSSPEVQLRVSPVLRVSDNLAATQTQLNALPTYDKDGYDDAMAYRDGLLRERGQAVDNKLYNEDGTAFESVGAAEKGFSGKEAYYDLLTDDNVKPGRADDVRQMEIPEKDAYGRRVTDFAANAAGAGVTTDEMADAIAELIGDGALGFDTRTHQQSLENAAKRIKDKGSYAARESITKAVMNGKVQDGDIETAMLLYAREAKRGKVENASELIVDLATMANMTGRNLNLFKLLRKMTPEGQLMAVQKDITRNLEKINKGRKAQKQVGQEDGKQIADAGNEAKKDVVKQLDVATVAVSVKGGKVRVNKSPKSQPFWFEYAQKVGEALAKSLRPKGDKTRTTMEVITSQLRRFASEKVPDREKKAGMSATDLLRDYVQNQDFYDRAWKAAQEELRNYIRQKSDAAKSGQEMVENGQLEELAQAAIMVNEGIGVNATARERNKLFMRAIVESALETGEDVRTLQKQSALGFTNMAQSISEHLIRKTGATGEMAGTIHAAVEDYVRKETSDTSQNDRLLQNAIQEAMTDIHETLSKTAKSSYAQRSSTKKKIVDLLVGKYNIGKTDASNVAAVVGEYFDEMTRQRAQEILKQKFANKKKPVPKEIMELFEEYANLGAFDVGSEFNQAAARKLFGDKAGEIPTDLGKAFLDAKTDSDKEKALDDIYKYVAAKIKPTLGEAWDAWRNLSMLGNFKTHGRNFFSAGAFRPYVAVKRGIGAIIEHFVLDQENRTKAILGLSKDSRELLKWAQQDAKSENVQNLMDYSGTTGDNARSEIEKYRKYLPGPLDKVRKANLNAMEWEDMVWKKREYSLSLASFLKARGYTAEQVTAGEVPAGVMQEARAYAVEEAKRATFNDRNKFSDLMAKLRIKDNKPWSKAANAVLKGDFPFTRTPANVLKRFTEYSPAGIASGIYKLANDVKTGEATVAEGIDRIASGLTGTGAMALGAALAAGLIPGIRLVGKLDEEEKLEGAQEYSIQIGDQYYSISWLAPANIPLFIGANLYSNLSQKGETDNLDVWDVLSALAETASDALDPMLELSMLSSLNDVINAVAYEDTMGDKVLAFVASSATSYFTQGLPTIFGQAEQSTEETKKSVYSNADNPMQRAFEQTAGRATQKIPGIDLYQTEKVDEWGRPVENADTWVERALNAFFNPFTVSKEESTPVTREILRLNGAQDENLLPKTVGKTLTYTDKDGKLHENYRLTAEEYRKLATVQGQTAARILDQLVKSKDYKKLTDAQKAKAFQLAYEYAREKGRTEAVNGYDGLIGWKKGITGKEVGLIIQKALAADFAGSESTFNQLTAGGIKPETAYDIGELLKGIEPQTGYKTVRDIQQAEAIAGYKLTEAEKIAALKAYGSDAQDENLDAVLAEGYSADQYVGMWRMISDEKEKGGDGTKRRTIELLAEAYRISWADATELYEIFYPKSK